MPARSAALAAVRASAVGTVSALFQADGPAAAGRADRDVDPPLVGVDGQKARQTRLPCTAAARRAARSTIVITGSSSAGRSTAQVGRSR